MGWNLVPELLLYWLYLTVFDFTVFDLFNNHNPNLKRVCLICVFDVRCVICVFGHKMSPLFQCRTDQTRVISQIHRSAAFYGWRMMFGPFPPWSPCLPIIHPSDPCALSSISVSLSRPIVKPLKKVLIVAEGLLGF